MQSYRLHKPDGTPTNLFACGLCNKLQHPFTVEHAEQCCGPVICRFCNQKVDQKAEHRSSTHSKCRDDDYRKRELFRLGQAKLVEYDGGMLYAEHLPGGDDGFYSDIDSLIDDLEDADPEDGKSRSDWVLFAFCTTPNRRELDLESVLDDLCEDGYEDMTSCLRGVPDLREAVDAFNKRNENTLTTYRVDYTRKVAVPYKVEA